MKDIIKSQLPDQFLMSGNWLILYNADLEG